MLDLSHHHDLQFTFSRHFTNFYIVPGKNADISKLVLQFSRSFGYLKRKCEFYYCNFIISEFHVSVNFRYF